MIKLKSESRKPPGLSRRWRWALLLLGLLILALAVEKGRGLWTLNLWKHQRIASGEIFDPRRLWPAASPGSVAFSNQFAQTTARPRGRLADYAGYLSGVIVEPSGGCRRGSQELEPPRLQPNGSTNTWDDLDELLHQAEPMLTALRELMRNPASTMGYDPVKCMDDNAFPYAVGVRVAAQTLQAAVLNDLHKGDVAGAGRDLGCLLSFAKLNEEDPILVSFMIRMAVIGLSIDVGWDALQADGWTEAQLATLQQQCADSSRILRQLPRAMEAERVFRIHQLHWFRSHSYEAWLAHYEPVYQSFGAKFPAGVAAPGVRLWRQWVFHPLWSFVWADQEELEYLRYQQLELLATREGVERGSWLLLKRGLAANRDSYRAPAAAWRFYQGLPLADHFMGPASGSACPYADFSRAYFTAMKNLTLHELLRTAISLKRYALRHGTPPAGLAALVPEFLPALPRDFMDGQALRYRLDPDGSFTLYSVGEDLRDDAGRFLATTPGSLQQSSPWDGSDWVWPQLVAAGKAVQVSKATSPGRAR